MKVRLAFCWRRMVDRSLVSERTCDVFRFFLARRLDTIYLRLIARAERIAVLIGRLAASSLTNCRLAAVAHFFSQQRHTFVNGQTSRGDQGGCADNLSGHGHNLFCSADSRER